MHRWATWASMAEPDRARPPHLLQGVHGRLAPILNTVHLGHEALVHSEDVVGVVQAQLGAALDVLYCLGGRLGCDTREEMQCRRLQG